MCRKELHFAELAKSNFCFLEQDFGFLLSECTETRAVYLQKHLGVAAAVWHGMASYELGFEVWVIGEERRYQLQSMLSAIGLSHLKCEYHGGVCDKISTGLGMMAALVNKYCIDYLRGDILVYERMEKIESKKAEDLTIETVLRPIRSKAEKAWKAKDYKTVVESYLSIGEQMTDTEARRYKFANSRC